jgi:membrane-associated phospholipid phosphatase
MRATQIFNGAIRQCLALALLGCTISPSLARAQVVLSTPDTARSQVHKHLFNHRDVIIAGALTATTFALFPLDKRLAGTLKQGENANRLFKTGSTGFELIALPGAYYIGGGLFLMGRLGNNSRLADLGWHGTEAAIVGEATTGLLKRLVGRSRPYVSDGADPRDFAFLKGFGDGDRRSFPSGHTTTAFAVAAAVTDETTIWWPRSTWVVGPIMYTGATMVGLSRMYHSRHWASDVALGAMVGIFSGKKVVMATHDNPNNFVDRIMLGTHVVPAAGGGYRIGWVVR